MSRYFLEHGMSLTAKARGISWKLLMVAAVSFGICHGRAFATGEIPLPGQPMAIGNLGNSLSYTYNAMPGQVIGLANANGDLITDEENTPGGWYLSDHATCAASLAIVSDTNLNIVVLQQQSAGAVDPASLQTLGGDVTAHGGQVILYETWGYVSTWQTDIPQLRQNYLAMAADVPGGATISPVGLAWWQVLTDRPDITLFLDDRHPTLAGAYLAGCVNYATIFGRSPLGNPYTSGTWGNPGVAALDPATATYLQGVADQTVFANPWATDQWGYGTNNFGWAYDWKNYTNLCGSTLPGTVISGGGGQPSPSVRVNTDVGAVDNVYLGVLDSAQIAGQGRLYVFDGGSLSSETLVVGQEGQGWVIQSGGTLVVGGTLTLGAQEGSYGTYDLSGDGTLDATGASIDIRNGIFNLTGGTVRFGMLTLEAGGEFVDSPNSVLIPSNSQSGISVETGTITINSQISGTGGLIKTGSGTLIVSNANSYSGNMNISAGTLIVSGALQGSAILVNNTGTLLGSGTVGTLTVASGGTVSPGNGVGTLSAGNTAFQPIGNFAMRLENATGRPGTGWSNLRICGTLDLSSLDQNQPFTFTLQTVTNLSVNGLLSDFSSTASYEWPVVYFSSLIGSFASDEFVVDTSHFANAFSGAFSIGLDSKTNSLDLLYTPLPEPGVSVLIAAGVGLLWAGRRTGRRNL